MKHELFSMTNPNRIRSVIGSFSQNTIQFHCQEGYQLLTEVIIELDQLNPQIAARFAGIYNHWRRFTAQYSKLQESQLNSIIQSDKISKDVYEIVQSAIKRKALMSYLKAKHLSELMLSKQYYYCSSRVMHRRLII